MNMQNYREPLAGISPHQSPLPLRLALEAGIFSAEQGFLDFDRDELQAADVVYWGYGLNRLSPPERDAALLKAWELTGQVLIVAAEISIPSRLGGEIGFNGEEVVPLHPDDQYYQHGELKSYLEETLGTVATPAGLGVYFLWRPGQMPQLWNLRVQEEESEEKQRSDWLVYLASEGVEKVRDAVTNSPEINDKIIALFGSWEEAQTAAAQLLDRVNQPGDVPSYCLESAVGKKLPGALYVHISALGELHPVLRCYEAIARRHIGQIEGATLVKFSIDKPKISYLFYPDFDTEAHPILRGSLQIDFPEMRISYIDYDGIDNPPVLHRKDAFVTPAYPLYELFVNLTQQEEKLGLLKKGRDIGTRHGWERCLANSGVEIEGHEVRVNAALVDQQQQNVPQIERHKAAILRREISRPVRLALEAGLFGENHTFFDYGCGFGGDVERLRSRGYESAGWDPYYHRDESLVEADVVNLGYVINVIEDLEERREALLGAWQLTKKVLIVAAMVLIDDKINGFVAYGDGVITRRNTFQKYYSQEELKNYIEGVLNVEAIPAALGIYFVFRDQRLAQIVQAAKFRTKTPIPRVFKSFEDYRELLQSLMEFACDRGRLPAPGELPEEKAILSEFATYRRAFQVITKITHPEEWEAIRQKRRRDLITYIAVSNFGRRHSLSYYSPEVRNDIKFLFPSYKKACEIAESLIFVLTDLNEIVNCCRESPVGLMMGKGFYIHVSALNSLAPLLRIYEGIVSRTVGRLDEATVIKFHTKSHKISYLYYPNFDINAHPVLYSGMKIDLRDLRVTYYDYDSLDNPPILHSKERLVTTEYPHYEKFAKLTRQEKAWGILDDQQGIITRKDFGKILDANCAEIRHHRVSWRKGADPDRIKLVKAARKARFRG